MSQKPINPILSIQLPKMPESDQPAFEAAEHGREIGAQLRQKVFASLTPAQRDAIKTALDLAEIYDQVAPSDLYRVPKAKPSAGNLQANIKRAERLILALPAENKMTAFTRPGSQPKQDRPSRSL